MLPLLLSTAALIACSFFLFVPLQVYLGNIREYSIPVRVMATFLAGWSMVALVGLVIPGLLLPFRIRRWYCILLFGVGVAAYVQSNLLVWDYGLLDGKELNWGANAARGWLDLAVWTVVLGGSFLLRDWIAVRGTLVAVALLIVQTGAACVALLTKERAPSHHYYSIDDSELVTFSPVRNVLVVLLDSFQSNTFMQLVESEPERRERYRGFVYFPDAVSGYAKTMGSVPNILTGKFYDNSRPMDEHLRESYGRSVLSQLVAKGYRVELYPINDKLVHFDTGFFSNIAAKKNPRFAGSEMAAVFDVSVFRGSPHALKKLVAGDGVWLVTRVREFLRSGADRQPEKSSEARKGTAGGFFDGSRFRDLDFHRALAAAAVSEGSLPRFKFIHLGGPHEPFIYESDLVVRRLPHGKEGYIRQARGSLRILDDLLATLERLGVADRTDVIVVSDHGAGEYGVDPPGNEESPSLAPKGVRSSGLPLVMIKRGGSTAEFRVAASPVALADIPPTIASLTGLPVNPGEISLTEAIPETRIRKYNHYVYEGWSRQFLPPLEEYEVTGNSWDPSSWKRTGRVMLPQDGEDTDAGGSGGIVEQRWEFGIGETGQTLLQEGWSRPEDGMVWTASREATIRMPVVPSSRAGMLEFLATPYLAGKAIESQPVEVILNGFPVANWIMDQRGRYSVFVPERMAKESAFTVEFRIPNAASPSEMTGVSQDVRTLGFSLESLVHRSLPDFPKDGILRFTKNGNAHSYHLWGWSEPEESTTWTNGKSVAILVFGNPDGRPRVLTANVSPNLKRGLLTAQRVKIRVAGEEVGSWAISEPSVLAVPFQPSEQGWTVVEFLLPDAAAPIDHPTDPTPDQRVLGLRVDLMTVEDRAVQK